MKKFIIFLIICSGLYKLYNDNKIELLELYANFTGRPWRAKVHAFYVDGKVLLKRNSTIINVKNQTIFKIGDVITTGPNGYLVIRFGYESKIKLFENTTLEIDDLLLKEKQMASNRHFHFDLKIGSLFVDATKGKSKLKLTANSAKIKVTGTQFISTVGQNGNVKLAVLHGKVKVKSKIFAKESLIKTKEGTIITNLGHVMPTKDYRWVQKINWKKAANNVGVDFLKEKIANFKKEKGKSNAKISFSRLKEESKKISLSLNKYSDKSKSISQNFFKDFHNKHKILPTKGNNMKEAIKARDSFQKTLDDRKKQLDDLDSE
mgnify:CR=1 FL=1